MSVAEMELKSFSEFVAEQIERDDTLSLQQCFDRWLAKRERAETIAAVREGVADAEAGRVYSLEEVDAEIRKKYGFPPASE